MTDRDIRFLLVHELETLQHTSVITGCLHYSGTSRGKMVAVSRLRAALLWCRGSKQSSWQTF